MWPNPESVRVRGALVETDGVAVGILDGAAIHAALFLDGPRLAPAGLDGPVEPTRTQEPAAPAADRPADRIEDEEQTR